MYEVLVLGAGKIGGAVADMLAASGEYDVAVADRDSTLLAAAAPRQARRLEIDVADETALAAAMRGRKAVLSALPFFLNPLVARTAAAVGAHYFDLTEDVATTRAVRAAAENAATAFMPQCGLAPGFIGVVAHDLAQRLDKVRDVHMRVGALPQFPVNALKYNLTWSTDGLINEYCNPCEAIHEGRLVEAAALEGLEHFALDGTDYEAFNTSGGLGTLCETLAGRVQSLNYKTVRYPGHRAIIHLLLEDLRLRDRRELLKDVLETAVPTTRQDVVVIFVTATGWRDNRLVQESYARKIYARELGGREWSAIQLTTAAGLCAMVDLHREGKLPRRGFIRQEQATLADFLANRFGRHYAQTARPLQLVASRGAAEQAAA